MEKNSSSQGSILPGLLLVLFIGLKLTKVISWSWLWVLSPIWIPCILLIAVVVLAFILK